MASKPKSRFKQRERHRIKALFLIKNEFYFLYSKRPLQPTINQEMIKLSLNFKRALKTAKNHNKSRIVSILKTYKTMII